jgi:hypothetical protein
LSSHILHSCCSILVLLILLSPRGLRFLMIFRDLSCRRLCLFKHLALTLIPILFVWELSSLSRMSLSGLI